MEKQIPRKIFTVTIQKQKYDVYDIKGKEHEGLNDTIKTWWLYYSNRLPDNTLPPIDSDHWEPYSVGIIRRPWEIKIKQQNTSKYKWNDWDFRNHISVEMYCNDKLVYEFGSGGKYLDFAMAKVQYMQVMMSEHPYDFFEPEKMKGRKIYWYGLPATIEPRSSGWEIKVYPDYTAGLSKEEWWKEYAHRKKKLGDIKITSEMDKQDAEMEKEELEEDIQDEYINWGDAFSDQHIDWFRK